MTVPDARRRLRELDEEECRQLLGTAVIGRIAYTEGALPAIQPVHFSLLGGHIYIPTRPGSKVAAAAANAVVAFEADDFDPATRMGWSVTAIGASRLVTDPEHIESLQALGLEPWAPTPHRCYIAIRAGIWRGRRLFAPLERMGLDEAS
jgi:nitroimidazol reductase NimA-like FMN-containing flavoprotein (pyridoxamine 5'-phosphate oxidase superfamily)